MAGPSAAIYGCAGLELTGWERDFFARTRPFGFILFARNCESPDQVRALTASLRDAAGHDATVLIDQEGGRVQRLRPPYWRNWSPALEQSAGVRPGQAARAMFLRYRIIAHELRAIGIDSNCAPLADIARADTHPVLRNRCYGDTPLAVVGAARAVAQGTLAGGVLPVLKHVPGHGRSTLDSHLDLPRVDASLETLRASDFATFQALCDLPMAMTAHIVYDALDPERPATQSEAVIGTIRREIGYDGLLMTDDLSMQALAGSMRARAAASLEAGCDVVLHCNGAPEEMTEVASAVPPLQGAALRRAGRALARRGVPEAVDIEALDMEYAECLA